jgi:nucleoside-diphosphate-sugar epimerase
MNEKKIIFLGGTGLIGSQVLKILSKNTNNINAFSRRSNTNYPENVQDILFNFNTPFSEMDIPNCDHLFICIGRSLKLRELLYMRKKDRKNHFKIEHDYVFNIAKKAKDRGVNNLSIISAVGANSNSSNFYLSTKGFIEESLKNLGYKNISILRPGHIIVNKGRGEIGFIVWIIDIFFKLVNPFLRGFLRKYRGISLEKFSEFMANEEMAGTKIFYYDDFIK